MPLAEGNGGAELTPRHRGKSPSSAKSVLSETEFVICGKCLSDCGQGRESTPE